jgi:hypothetical protein
MSASFRPSPMISGRLALGAPWIGIAGAAALVAAMAMSRFAWDRSDS